MASEKVGADLLDTILTHREKSGHHDVTTLPPSMSEHKCIALLRQMAWIVTNIHLAGIAHNDLKAENFLIPDNFFTDDSESNAFLIDFGSAEFIENGKKPPVVTPSYSPPEAFLDNNPSMYDSMQLGDAWALGLISHFLLVGHPLSLCFNDELDQPCMFWMDEIKLIKCNIGTYIMKNSLELTHYITTKLTAQGREQFVPYLLGLLHPDPQRRLTVFDALQMLNSIKA